MIKNWRAARPPPTLIIFPKSSDQNSEIAILFSVVEKPYNYVFPLLGELSFEGFVMGEENSHEGSAGFSTIIKK